MQYHKKVQEFLEEVNGQIRYGAMCAAIDEELAAHIEDKAELYREYGIEEEDAIARAVRDMGDAVEIGIQMNAAHHTRVCWPLFGIALGFLLLGVLGNVRHTFQGVDNLQSLVEGILDSWHLFLGAAVLLVVMQFGYPTVIRRIKKICVVYLIISVAAIGWDLISSASIGWGIAASLALPYWVYSPLTLHFCMFLLAAPVLAVFAYRQRRKGVNGLLASALFVLVVWISQSLTTKGDYLYMAILALFITFLVVLLYMSRKGYLDMPGRKAVIWILALFAGLVLCVSVREGSLDRRNELDERTPLYRTMELFLTPEKQASSTWADGYNGVLMRELLGRARIWGEMEASPEEMFDYATGAWYYGEEGAGEWSATAFQTMEEHVDYLLQFVDPAHVEVEDILPQSYHNNYRIAYWILKYGWAVGGLLLAAILFFGYWLIRVSIRIRNRLGRLVAFAGSICLLVQYLFYILGNFGHQFAWFGNLPFLSEGIVSVLVNAVLLGLVLSAYRYDLVMEEKLENEGK